MNHNFGPDIPNPDFIIILVEKLIELIERYCDQDIITQEIELQDMNPVQIGMQKCVKDDWIFINKYKK